MADVNRSKLQLRAGLPTNGDKTPSPATKLLINHGKPNFTIQRSHKTQNGNVSPTSPPPAKACNGQNNNNGFVVKSTTFNGVFKPSNISIATKQTLSQNGNNLTKSGDDNEAAKVVLRRTKVAPTEIREGREDDDNVPEFIRRQRRIQERLANQNILDFENRRSGYFTQVLISPSSPNRQSFVETMASPAVKPGLEIPPPPTHHEEIENESSSEEQQQEEVEPKEQLQSKAESAPETLNVEPVISNGQVENTPETLSVASASLNGQVEEEEVAKAIEEVNKAVAGEAEDDDKAELEEHEAAAVAVLSLQPADETEPKKKEEQQAEKAASENTLSEEVLSVEPAVSPIAEVTQESTPQEYCQADVAAALDESKAEEPQTNGHVKEHHVEDDVPKTNNLENEIIISHVNGTNGPSIPAPDPKGEKGVNFEPKTVVSFSQELGNGDNKYPDTVKVLKDIATTEADSELKELTKLKFEIKTENQDIEVKPVLINETA